MIPSRRHNGAERTPFLRYGSSPKGACVRCGLRSRGFEALYSEPVAETRKILSAWTFCHTAQRESFPSPLSALLGGFAYAVARIF
jgi:hypothetical protein